MTRKVLIHRKTKQLTNLNHVTVYRLLAFKMKLSLFKNYYELLETRKTAWGRGKVNFNKTTKSDIP